MRINTNHGLQTTAREASSSGRKDSLLIMKKQYIYENTVDLVECNILRNNNITQGFRPSKCCVTAYVAFAKKRLETPGIGS